MKFVIVISEGKSLCGFGLALPQTFGGTYSQILGISFWQLIVNFFFFLGGGLFELSEDMVGLNVCGPDFRGEGIGPLYKPRG